MAQERTFEYAGTYQELFDWLKTLTDKQKQCDVTIHTEKVNEFIPVHHFGITGDSDDVLDSNHPFLGFK